MIETEIRLWHAWEARLGPDGVGVGVEGENRPATGQPTRRKQGWADWVERMEKQRKRNVDDGGNKQATVSR